MKGNKFIRIDIPLHIPILSVHCNIINNEHKVHLYPSKTLSNGKLMNKLKKVNTSWTEDSMLVRLAFKMGKSKAKRARPPLNSLFTSVNSSLLSSYEEKDSKASSHGATYVRKC